MLALGVDVSVARGLDLVLLDERRHLVGPPLRGRSARDVGGLIAERKPDVVAIDSPPSLGRSGGSRLAERELLRLGIHSYCTPSDPERAKRKFYDWMRAGFLVFAEARRAGCALFADSATIRGSAIEVFPHGSSVALRGCLPPAGTCRRGLGKRRWRAAALEAEGVETKLLRSTDEVDAALAALTGLLALEGNFWTVGDAGEGAIVLPGERPRRRFVVEIGVVRHA